MIAVHIESGLGNQMLDYVDYLAYKQKNPNEECYIENVVFQLSETDNVIKFWNGYELDRVFGINAPNISEYLGNEGYEKFFKSMQNSKFWEKNWSYPEAFENAMNQFGYSVQNHCSGGKVPSPYNPQNLPLKMKLKYEIPMTNQAYIWLTNATQPFRRKKIEERVIPEHRPVNYYLDRVEDIKYVGHNLEYMYKNNGIEELDDEVKSIFRFPKYEVGSKNETLITSLNGMRSASLHVRRGDFLGGNFIYYKNGFFNRSINYIRKKDNPNIFLIFCDSDSIQWCRDNYKMLGLTSRDEVVFVDWNKGVESYRDMQLMTHTNHVVTTGSSFGWWASFLNPNPDKITCVPHPAIRATNWF